MENSSETPQPITPLPQAPQAKIGTGRILAMLISIVIIVIVLVLSGYLLFFNKGQKTTPNIQVYNQSTVTPTITPIPSTYQINVKDTSDNAINQDTQAADQDLNNLNSNLNNVNQSFNDQQTNLQ
ncbi:MAG: hypothetical protein ABSE17_02360 [Candidatus Levyibacteriota bacterium]|jgi:predicted PurR-regulated permease PerM